MRAFPWSLPAFRTAHSIANIAYRLEILALTEVKNPKGDRLQETSLAQAVTEDYTVTKDQCLRDQLPFRHKNRLIGTFY